MLRGSLDGRGFDRAGRRTDTCICMAESLGCSPETFTTLFISFTPTQNNKLKKIKKDVEMFWVHSTAPIGGNYTPPAIQDCRMQLSQTSGVYHHAVAARKKPLLLLHTQPTMGIRQMTCARSVAFPRTRLES